MTVSDRIDSIAPSAPAARGAPMAVSGHAPRDREIHLADAAATDRLAASVAALARPGDAILLMGDLGTGKTRFARGFIAARAGRALDVPSPTFTLVQTYDLAGGAVWHFDLYRLERAQDAAELGFDEAFAEGISLVEWPDRLAGQVPADRLEIVLAYGMAPEERRATLTGFGRWVGLLPRLCHA
jgi:tRNA threonylcarbamoyladenosine biosynthesis protein TsaE